MRAHTPPFTKPEAAYDSRRLYEETSAIAAAQDAKHAMTDAERDAKLRTVAHYIYHAKLLMDEVFAESKARSRELLAECARDTQAMCLYADADTPEKSPNASLPAESSYLASFGPNADIPSKSPKADRRVLTAAERKAWGIGDVEPATLRGIPDSFTDSHGNRITRRDATRHPMHAEALRDHDERLFGGEDRL